MSITPLIGMEDAHIALNVSRPSPKAILNGEINQYIPLIFLQRRTKRDIRIFIIKNVSELYLSYFSSTTWKI
nr:hypothetical protein [uncultured Mediterraneibacter sp.]